MLTRSRSTSVASSLQEIPGATSFHGGSPIPGPSGQRPSGFREAPTREARLEKRRPPMARRRNRPPGSPRVVPKQRSADARCQSASRGARRAQAAGPRAHGGKRDRIRHAPRTPASRPRAAHPAGTRRRARFAGNLSWTPRSRGTSWRFDRPAKLGERRADARLHRPQRRFQASSRLGVVELGEERGLDRSSLVAGQGCHRVAHEAGAPPTIQRVLGGCGLLRPAPI